MHHVFHFLANPGLVSHAGHGLRLAADHAPHAAQKVAGPAGFAVGKVAQAAVRLFFI